MPLTPQQQRVVDQLDSLAKDAKKTNFKSSKEAQQDNEAIKNLLLDQKGYHREELLGFIKNMTLASFSLLVVIVIFQMMVRLWNQNYVGVSDAVIKILTVGVFGQIIGIVASIVLAVWKDND